MVGGQDFLGRNRKAAPGFRLRRPAVEEVRPCAQRSLNEGRGPEYTCGCSGVGGLGPHPGSFGRSRLHCRTAFEVPALAHWAARPRGHCGDNCTRAKRKRGGFFVKLGDVISGLGRTRHFWKIASRLPKLSEVA